MKFIGQYIQSFIARFRNDVYLEDIDTGTIASGGNLGLDSNNKIVKATVSSGSGDITGVDLTGAGPISINSETGTTSGDYSATIGIASASATVIGVVELATTAETTTGTDTTRAVTPGGLKDGYQGSGSVTTVGIISSGEWRGTAINAAYLSGQSGTNTGDETLASINALDVTEVGTIDSGVWNGTAIASAYLDADTAHLSGNQTFGGLKTFGVGGVFNKGIISEGNRASLLNDGTAIHVDAQDVTDESTSASGTAAAFRHVSIERPRLMATNSSVTTTDASTLYISNSPLASTNQTITNAWSLWVDGGNARFDGSIYSGTTEAVNSSGLLTVANQSNITGVGTISSGTWQGTAIAHAYIGTDAIETDNIADAQVTVAKLHADAIQTSGESFADNDTSLMTSAAIDDKINTKYSTSYITFSAKSTSSYGTNYVMIHASGISESTFSVDSSVDSAGDFGGVTTEEGGSGTDATATVASGNLEQQIPIPETCKLIGFYATTTTSTNTGTAYDTGVAIWHVPESGVNWGSSTASTATLIHKSDSSRHTEGSNRKKVQKVERMDGTAKTLGAGDILIPSIFGETSNQQIMATITLVIATPIKTL